MPKNIECKKKGILNLAYKQGLLFEKSKELDKFKEMYKKNGASRTWRSVRKYPKLKVVMNLNGFNDVETW